MKVRTMTLAGVALVAVVALGVFGTLRWASAIGSDVNNDGQVNIIDIGHIVRDFGQTVPVPAPEPHEAVTTLSVNVGGLNCSWSGPGSCPWGFRQVVPQIAIDPGNYPEGTQFTLSFIHEKGNNTAGDIPDDPSVSTGCYRLSNIDDFPTRIPEYQTEVCSQPSCVGQGDQDIPTCTVSEFGEFYNYIESEPFSLPPGPHIYELSVWVIGQSFNNTAVRIHARWTE